MHMCSISHLPSELLATIAEFCAERHPDEGYVICSSSLATLSSVSPLLRAVATPILFREIAITNEDQLTALSHTEPKLLARCR